MGIGVAYPKPNLSKRNFQEAIVPYLLRNKVASFPSHHPYPPSRKTHRAFFEFWDIIS